MAALDARLVDLASLSPISAYLMHPIVMRSVRGNKVSPSYLYFDQAFHGLDLGFTEGSSVLGADVGPYSQVGWLIHRLQPTNKPWYCRAYNIYLKNTNTTHTTVITHDHQTAITSWLDIESRSIPNRKNKCANSSRKSQHHDSQEWLRLANTYFVKKKYKHFSWNEATPHDIAKQHNRSPISGG